MAFDPSYYKSDAILIPYPLALAVPYPYLERFLEAKC